MAWSAAFEVWLVVFAVSRIPVKHAHGQVLPRPCTDLKPLYLMELVAGNRQELPPGVEIVYDDKFSIHAYRFTKRAEHLRIPAQTALPYCNYFPEEFSILVTFKLISSFADKEECVFSLTSIGSHYSKMALRFHKHRLYFDYSDRKTSAKEPKQVDFKIRKLYDGDWHTVILSITGTSAILVTDCGLPRIKQIDRIFPAFLDTSSSDIFIGNCDGKRGQFAGMIKQMLIMPGADVSQRACPSRAPHMPALTPSPGRVLPTDPMIPEGTDADCTWKDTGKMWFDIYSKSLKVCYSGVWQAVLLPPDQRRQKQMDYFVWHQDIITPAPTIDMEVFEIPGEGLFMAAASYRNNMNLSKQPSAIFKWANGSFKLVQYLTTLGTQGWEHFMIGKRFFLAVANYGTNRNKKSKSIIYVWSKKRKRFRVYQEIVTWTARDVEYFEINNNHYIAIANHEKGSTTNIDSVIYQWDFKKKIFVQSQLLPTVAAYDWTHFVVSGNHFLVVANAFNGKTTRVNSVIYFWENEKFVQFQTIQTVGATDWEFFEVGDEYFLVVANAYDYGPRNFGSVNTNAVNSTIYRLNTLQKRFEHYQTFVTHSAIDWESFWVGDDFYLVVSNAQNGGSEQTKSVVYRWQGMDKFVPVHYLDIGPSADWETFTSRGDVYLVFANPKDRISQVLKVKFL